jgi:hypothetical protein
VQNPQNFGVQHVAEVSTLNNSWLIQLQMTVISSDLAAAWPEALKVDANTFQSPFLLLAFHSRRPTDEAAPSAELGHQRSPVISFLPSCFFVRAVLGDVELGRNPSGISRLSKIVSRAAVEGGNGSYSGGQHQAFLILF